MNLRIDFHSHPDHQQWIYLDRIEVQCALQTHWPDRARYICNLIPEENLELLNIFTLPIHNPYLKPNQLSLSSHPPQTPFFNPAIV